MKRTKLATALLITSLTMTHQAIASDSNSADWFVGGSVGAGFNDIKASSGSNLKDPDSPVKYDVRAGAFLNDHLRVYATYSYGNDDATHDRIKTELTEQQLLLSADYVFGTGNIKPFVGVSLGATNSEFEVNGNNGFTEDDTAIAFGGQLGLLYGVNNWDFELGYRHIWQDNEINRNNIKLENKSSGVVYGSVNYRF